MSKSILRGTHFRRAVYYFSGIALAVFAAVVIPAAGIWFKADQHPAIRQHGYWIVGIFVTLGLAAVVARNVLDYRRIRYDPQWALAFQDRFDKMQEKTRPDAAKILLEHRGELGDGDKVNEFAGVDDVLDFFEDIGLYQRADHISPELAHHHFFHWIRGYWQAAEPYIGAWRTKEPFRWNHLEELFDTVCDIESREHGGKLQGVMLSDSEIETFLRQELGEAEETTPSA